MSFELSIVVKNEEKKMVSRHLCYEPDMKISKQDPALSKLVDNALKAFGEGVEDVILKFKMIW